MISAEIEAEFYCRYTRVEEIIEFSRRMGFHKIGIATCIGLIEESRIFAQILRKNGFEPYAALCKAGACIRQKRITRNGWLIRRQEKKNNNLKRKMDFKT